MQIKNLSIPLNEMEMRQLQSLASQECRRPRDQAYYILRTALQSAQQQMPKPGTQTGQGEPSPR